VKLRDSCHYGWTLKAYLTRVWVGVCVQQTLTNALSEHTAAPDTPPSVSTCRGHTSVVVVMVTSVTGKHAWVSRKLTCHAVTW